MPGSVFEFCADTKFPIRGEISYLSYLEKDTLSPIAFTFSLP